MSSAVKWGWWGALVHWIAGRIPWNNARKMLNPGLGLGGGLVPCCKPLLRSMLLLFLLFWPLQPPSLWGKGGTLDSSWHLSEQESSSRFLTPEPTTWTWDPFSLPAPSLSLLLFFLLPASLISFLSCLFSFSIFPELVCLIKKDPQSLRSWWKRWDTSSCSEGVV